MFGSFAVLVQLIPRLMIDRGWIGPTADDPGVVAGLAAKVAGVGAMMAAGLCALAITLTWLRLCNRDAWQQLGLPLRVRDIVLGLRGAVMILPPVLLASFAASYFVPYEHQVLEDLARSPQPRIFRRDFRVNGDRHADRGRVHFSRAVAGRTSGDGRSRH